MSLEFTGELFVMTMKNYATLGGGGGGGGGLTCRVKIDMRNLTDFDTNTQKSKI